MRLSVGRQGWHRGGPFRSPLWRWHPGRHYDAHESEHHVGTAGVHIGIDEIS
jgi:hypothetical protein